MYMLLLLELLKLKLMNFKTKWNFFDSFAPNSQRWKNVINCGWLIKRKGVIGKLKL